MGSPKYFELVVSNEDLRNKMTTFDNFSKNIMSQPKPKKEEPKKEEPKKEEPKKEESKNE